MRSIAICWAAAGSDDIAEETLMVMSPDFDQSGMARRTFRTDLGPSVGWAEVPYRSLLQITMPGTFRIDSSINLVTVAVPALTFLILPAARMAADAGAQPRLSVGVPIQFVDAGGFAGSFPITIQPISGAETILGQAQIQITTNFGGLILLPISAQRTWVTVT
jgi:hypothetical protein